MKLISTNDIQVDLHCIGSRSVIFTFTERTFKDLGHPGFGTEHLIDRGFDVVAVKTNRDVWYENLSEAQLTNIATVGKSYAMRGGYGSSMGAYAAIRFSKALALDRVLAISPLFDIKAAWEKRWQLDRLAMNADPMMQSRYISDATDYFLIADSRSQDGVHVSLYRDMIANLHFIDAPFSGHPSGYFLSQIGALSPIVQSVFEHGHYPNMRPYKTRKGRSAVYLFRLANACMQRKKLKSAEALSFRALAISPREAEYHMQMAQILAARHAVPDAIEFCRRAIELNRDKSHFRSYLEKLLRT